MLLSAHDAIDVGLQLLVGIHRHPLPEILGTADAAVVVFLAPLGMLSAAQQLFAHLLLHFDGVFEEKLHLVHAFFHEPADDGIED